MLPPRATRSAHLREDGANVYADGAELRDGIPTDLNVVKMELTQAPHVHVHVHAWTGVTACGIQNR